MADQANQETLSSVLETNKDAVLVFSKPDCQYCTQCKELLSSIKVTPTEKILADLSDPLKQELAVMVSGAGAEGLTVPQVFIGGKLVGGFGHVKAAYDQGSLFGLLSASGIEATPPSDLDVAQLLAARKAMVPDPYIEDSLAKRNLLSQPTEGVLHESVENLYTFDRSTGIFNFEYMERNKSYENQPDDSKIRVRDQKPEPMERTAKVALELTPADSPKFTYKINNEIVEKWGIKFIGTIDVMHTTGETHVIYMPGVLTFDPAGITGDSHSSERVGPSCARMQTGITLSQLFVLQNGGSMPEVEKVQSASEEIIFWFNGRLSQWKWMKLQVQQACVENTDVTPYPDFIKELVAKKELNLDPDNRVPTREYLATYDAGEPIPPMGFFAKVNEKGCSCFEKL